MKMFLGEYSPNITDGSRVALPKKMREQLSGDFVIVARGFEKCVHVYDISDWSTQAQKQIDNQGHTEKISDLERYIFTSAEQVSIDTQGRIVLPQALKDYADIKKGLAVIGVGERIEVWDKNTWQEYKNKISAKLSE